MTMFRATMFGVVFAVGSVGVSGAFGQAKQTSEPQTQQSSGATRASNDATPTNKTDGTTASKPGAGDASAQATGTQPVNDKQKKLAEETDKLLAMATDLKQQVDKTNKDVLSVDVIKKAEEIEKLARSLKQEMKQQ